MFLELGFSIFRVTTKVSGFQGFKDCSKKLRVFQGFQGIQGLLATMYTDKENENLYNKKAVLFGRKH